MPEAAERQRCKENHQPPRTRSITKEFRVLPSFGVVSVGLAESVTNHQPPRTRSITKEFRVLPSFGVVSVGLAESVKNHQPARTRSITKEFRVLPSWGFVPFVVTRFLTHCSVRCQTGGIARVACIRIEVCQTGLLVLKKRSLCCRCLSRCCGRRSRARKLSKRLRPSNRLSAIEFF